MSGSNIEDKIMKYCKFCKEDLPLDDFSKCSDNKKDGRENKCKKCTKSYRDKIKKEKEDEKNRQRNTIKVRFRVKLNEMSLCENYDRLLELDVERDELMKLLKIEVLSVPKNTITFTYSQLFERRENQRIPTDIDFHIRCTIVGILSSHQIEFGHSNDIGIIPFEETCTFVIIKEGFSMTEDQKRMIINSRVVPQ
jgi:hypothetical protein